VALSHWRNAFGIAHRCGDEILDIRGQAPPSRPRRSLRILFCRRSPGGYCRTGVDCPKFPTGPLLISGATGLHQTQFWIPSQFLSEVIE
jgi:hypothetical protein